MNIVINWGSLSVHVIFVELAKTFHLLHSLIESSQETSHIRFDSEESEEESIDKQQENTGLTNGNSEHLLTNAGLTPYFPPCTQNQPPETPEAAVSELKVIPINRIHSTVIFKTMGKYHLFLPSVPVEKHPKLTSQEKGKDS